MTLHSHFDPKTGTHAIAGPGRLDRYERPAAAAIALERQRFVKAALRLIEATRYGPYIDDLEDVLGCSPFARGLMAILRDGITPREWTGVLERLEQIVRWQAGVDAQAEGEEAAR